MDTDEHGFYRADIIFEHESHELHEYFWHTDGHGWTRIYRADIIFEHEFHEFHEYFLAHGWTRMDTDFTVRRITLFILPQIPQMNTDLESLKGA